MRRMSCFFLLLDVSLLSSGVEAVARMSKRTDVPRNGRIAILIRGQAFRKYSNGQRFRGGVPPCLEEMTDDQINVSQSLLEKIIVPLQEQNNKVDVVITDSPCKLTRKINKLLGSVVLASKQFETSGQADDMAKAIDAFIEAHQGHEKLKEYDMIFITRHDIEWLMDIRQWEADFSKLNFFARCEPGAARNVGGEDCVYDNLHVMPGPLFQAFADTIGKDPGCFLTDTDPLGWGHACLNPLTAALPGKISFITDWRPSGSVRANNDWFRFMKPGQA